jgi:hypothetical protein
LATPRLSPEEEAKARELLAKVIAHAGVPYEKLSREELEVDHEAAEMVRKWAVANKHLLPSK